MKKNRILVVHDEPDMRTFLSTLFRSNGYEPIAAADSAEGIEKARQMRPHLIVLDIMTPHEEGLQLYGELRADEDLRHIPVIMLSGLTKKIFFHSFNLLTGRDVPVPEAYVEKPPDCDELLNWAAALVQARD